MDLRTEHTYRELSGTVYVKIKGIVIAKEMFLTRARCKKLIAAFSKQYPDFDVSVIMD